jgi:hypothetical protein
VTARGPLTSWQTGQRVTTFPLTSNLASIGDPDGARTITSIIALLVAIGLALLLLAIWIFRTTRPDPELLAPLEAMGERSWRRGDPVWQRRRLDELRPTGARPLTPSVAPPKLDESFDAGPTASGFDDLRGSDDASPDGEPPADTVASDDDTASVAPVPDATPAGAVGPSLDELPDVDFDQDALAAAREQLERELADAPDRPDEPLDLFFRDPNA